MRHTAILPLLLSSLILTTNAKFGKRVTCFDNNATPKLTLPWGTYEGKPYGADGETVLFNNVRFAKPPVGNLRFAAPEYPDAIPDSSKIQDSSWGPNCIQAAPSKSKHIFEDFPEPPSNETQSEDCLFLDVYVPAWVLDPEAGEKIPVVVWIFGGAYIFGGKNTTFDVEDGPPYNAYDGAGVRQYTDNGVIWVTGNYRLGAYGFLAGEYMEENAQPNAGLHDQRLLLDWVQKYIGQIGGDKNAVNVWGLSAGAGSILHHLTAYGGTKNEAPLFERAALWSTAFQWSYDRRGTLQETFDSFADAAGCSDSDNTLQCLRDAENKTLATANQHIVSDRLVQGMFPFGPAVDGDLVPDLPANLLKQGKHISISSMMLAHDFNEAQMFLADWVQTEQQFSEFVGYAFPGNALAIVRKLIELQYPSSAYDDQQARTRVLLRDSTFVCNNYQLYGAYKGSSQIYSSRYEVPPALHGSELLLLVWNREANIADLLKGIASNLPKYLIDLLGAILVPIANKYQTYFAGHALAGDPNYLLGGRFVNWEVTSDDEEGLKDVMRIGLQFINPTFFRLGADTQVSKGNCEFWNTMAQLVADAVKTDSVRGEEGSVAFKTQNSERLKVAVQVEL
ncbi:alpha/beta-hydrolase [Mollisia scopiformis]|uniref:Alpha/beta-hydrolase n=1 Tax=Mollisia scopiformis TaxID=149040 RepID=A0A194XEH6_MOLSC|nr:alpha/beta-hydrolase [Mollisia scopiformis]KUJ18549.1 alpha/beta-hydrolase [Mollisia scopiformis]